MQGKSKAEIDKKVFALIKECVDNIQLEELKSSAERSLLQFYTTQYSTLQHGIRLAVIGAVVLLAGRTVMGENKQSTQTERRQAVNIILQDRTEADKLYKVLSERHATVDDIINDNSRILGNAMQKYSEDYIKRDVTPVLKQLQRQYAQDPDSVGNGSLRNLAEMQVRYAEHLDSIAKLKEAGHQLAIVSSHTDCSKRCSKAQGQVVSLDGTTGTAPDGRHYEPLEKYTDVYVTTKSGKTYKNGLFGFNCRHYLIPYKDGYVFPKTREAVEAKQYEITKTQRAMEREVRYWRTEAIELKGIDPIAYRKARANAIEANKRYIAYSKEHNRAYYPSRVKII